MNMLYQILIAPIEAVMHVALSAIYGAIGSYGVSIFLLSLLTNVVLVPIAQMAERWQEAERKVQKILKPKLQEFRQAFSGEERHAMIHTLYRQAGYHPIYAMRSSFGLLLKLPFWIAAYQLLLQYQPLNGASFLIFEDLGKPDSLLWGFNLLPFVMTALNLAAAFVYTKSLSRTEQIQPLVIASLFLVLLYSAPAGLLLYWTFNCLFSLIHLALLDWAQTKDLAPADQFNSAPQKSFSSPARVGAFSAGSAENTPGGNRATLAPSVDEGRRQGRRFFELPMKINFGLFLVVAAVQTCLHIERFANQGGILEKGHLASGMAIGANIVLLAYLCLAFSWKTCHGAMGDLRKQSNVALVWLLFSAFALVGIAWFFQAYPELHPARTTGGILLLLMYFQFASAICNRIPILRAMPNSQWLYGASMCLSAFALFVANPITIYAQIDQWEHIGDFPGIAGALIFTFFACVFTLTTLYLLADQVVRNVMTVLAVFSVTAILSYSMIGVDGGLMNWFILDWPEQLARSTGAIAAECAVLFTLLGIAFVAVIYQPKVATRVMGAMLVATMCSTTIDFLIIPIKSSDDPNEVPSDHADIMAFSQSSNVLIIMLDGFPGRNLQRITEEMPDILSEYEGFVWYPNMLSTHAGTWGSIATMAGGYGYTVQEINNRREESLYSALENAYSVYPGAFIPEGYQVSYVNPQTAGPLGNRLCDKIDRRIHCTTTAPYGAYYIRREGLKAPWLDEVNSNESTLLSMVSIFKSVPFFLKPGIYNNGYYHGANSDLRRRALYRTVKRREWGFLRVLGSENTANSPSKTFKFIQVNIPHDPRVFDGDCNIDFATATIFSESVCAIKEVGRLLSKLKEQGIYDVTRIVIASDHGWWDDNPLFGGPEFTKLFAKGGSSRIRTGVIQSLLLVKDFRARKPLGRSDTFVSTPDIPSIVCSDLAPCEGVPYDPTKRDMGERKLTFSVTRQPFDEKKTNLFEIEAAYEVTRSIFDPQNWRKIR